MWSNKLKSAIATEDIPQIQNLVAQMPQDLSLEAMQEASYLIKAAITLLENKKNSTAIEMQNLKRNLNFLKSAQANPDSSFDVTS